MTDPAASRQVPLHVPLAAAADDGLDTPPRPALLLDVDGPLNPYEASNSTLPAGFSKARLASGYAQARVRLSRAHGPMLRRLAETHHLELVWATTWGTWAANQMIGPAVGLPELAGIEVDPTRTGEVEDREWKFAPVAAWAGERALAWFDDEFVLHHRARDEFLARRAELGAPTLLVDVSPKTGLTTEHLAQVADWAQHLAAAAPGTIAQQEKP